MKFSPTTRRPVACHWRLPLLMSFFLFAAFSMQAQEYVSCSVAKARLATKVSILEQQAAQGTISQLDLSINNRFIKIILNEIENQDFIWNTETSDKITQIFETTLNSAQTGTLQAYPQQASQINTIKEELDLLMQQ